MKFQLVVSAWSLDRGAKVALLPMVLAISFVSSPVLAEVVNLGTVMLDSDADSRTCFDGGNPCSSENESHAPNSSVSTAFSSGQATSNLGQVTSISAQGQASPLPGGGTVNPNFAAIGGGSVTLDYHFEVLGPQNISVPVSIIANLNVSVSGTLTGFDGYGSEARILIDGDGQTLANTDLFLQPSNTPQSDSFNIDKTDLLETNTAYEVFMQVGASASIDGITNITGLSASASIDPSFQLGPDAPSGYSIIFADGIGDAPSATPLPATLPLFAGGLSFVGYLARRRKSSNLAGARF